MREPGPAFIFDLDGVVIDSEPIRRKCLLLYLEQNRDALNVPVWPSMEGWTNDRIFTWLWAHTLGEPELSHHSAAHEALFRTMLKPHLDRYLKPGIVDFLACWDDVPTGLASNSARASIDFILDGANLRSRFDTIVDAREAGRPKPHPDIYLLAAKRLGVPPTNCIVFEDSPVGIAAASLAGAPKSPRPHPETAAAPVIRPPWQNTPRDQRRLHRPNRVISAGDLASAGSPHGAAGASFAGGIAGYLHALAARPELLRMFAGRTHQAIGSAPVRHRAWGRGGTRNRCHPPPPGRWRDRR